MVRGHLVTHVCGWQNPYRERWAMVTWMDGWKWEGVASVILQETVINTEFLSNQVKENTSAVQFR